MKPRQPSWKWLLAGFLVILVTGLAIVLPRQFVTSSELRDRVAASLSEWTGGTVTLTEPLRVRYFPPSVEGGLVLSNAAKLPAVRTIHAPDFKVSLSFPSLLTGQIEIDALQLGKPTISVGGSGDAEPAEHSFPRRLASLLEAMPVETIRIRRGRIVSATGKRLVRRLDVRLNARGGKGALAVQGSLLFNGETVAFALDSGRIRKDDSVRFAPLTLKLTSSPLTARYSGTIQFADEFEGTGEMQADLPDARRFLNWAGVALPEGDSLKNVTAAGTVHLSGSTLTFDDGTFAFDENEAVGLLAIVAGARPRIDGTLAFESLVLHPYIDIDVQEEDLFDWALLKYLDADLRLSASELFAGDLKLGRIGFTLNAKNGKISSELGELDLCDGQAAGRLELDISEDRTKASLTGDLSEIEIGNCLQLFALEMPLQGVGTLKFDVSTGGTSHHELIRGLAGKVNLEAREGVIPIDFSEVIATPSAEGHGWSLDSGTDFEALDAECSLSAGHLWCQSFHMQTPKGIVSGSGGLSLAEQTLDWDFLVADPVVPLDASQLVMKDSPHVSLNGPLSAPQIMKVDRSNSADGPPQTDTERISVTPH